MCVQPTLEALYLYDVAYMYALLADKSLTAGQSVRNGSLMLKNAIGFTFTGPYFI